MIESVSDSAGAAPDLKKARRRKRLGTLSVDRLPPQSIEAEQGVLGCIILDWKSCFDQAMVKLKTPEAFYDLRHQEIFKAMMELSEAGKEMDIILLQQHLKDRGYLEQIGGIPYLNSLQNCVPSVANLSYYLDYVIEKLKLRTLVQTCTDVISMVYEHEGELPELMDKAERAILKINQDENVEAKQAKPLVHAAIATIERQFERKGEITGLSTGFSDLDKYTDGLHGGEMIVIAARPSMGKTSLCMQIAEHVVIDRGDPVGVFSLEMTAESLMVRALCSRSRVNLRSIREGFMTEADFPKLTNMAGKFSKAPLYIDDTAGLSIIQLRARARRMWQQFGLKLIVVDYLQRLHSTAQKAQDNRQQEIADISSGLKSIAHELRIPVVVACQLNRESEKRTDRKPKMSDLRESGAIEQDADVVGLLYKPGVTNAEQDEYSPNDEVGVAVNLLIAKQRNGPAGVDVCFTFLKPYTRFESASKISDEDAPTH